MPATLTRPLDQAKPDQAKPNQAKLTAAQVASFHRDGFIIVRGLISLPEIQALVAAFEDIVALGTTPGLFEPRPGADPLDQFPRIMHPHRRTELAAGRLARQYLLDERVMDILAQLIGEEHIAAQSMYYFKPPGGRGQCLHQDDTYLATNPGVCQAAWLALDHVDPDNGGLFVVPGTQNCPLLPTKAADLSLSFSTDESVLPAGSAAPVPVVMAPGDMLFFNGRLVHGSSPNASPSRFRRSYICHYVPASTATMSEWYRPQIRRDGSELILPAPGAGVGGRE